jgi:PHD-finger
MKRKKKKLVAEAIQIVATRRIKTGEELLMDYGKNNMEDACAHCSIKDPSIGNDMVQCEGFCKQYYHIKCLVPPLDYVPPGSFICHVCSRRAKKNEGVDSEESERVMALLMNNVDPVPSQDTHSIQNLRQFEIGKSSKSGIIDLMERIRLCHLHSHDSKLNALAGVPDMRVFILTLPFAFLPDVLNPSRQSLPQPFSTGNYVEQITRSRAALALWSGVPFSARGAAKKALRDTIAMKTGVRTILGPSPEKLEEGSGYLLTFDETELKEQDVRLQSHNPLSDWLGQNNLVSSLHIGYRFLVQRIR